MTILQELLNLGLVDIGSDDSRFTKMETAGVELVNRLKEEPALIIPMTLVAINSEVDEEEAVFDIVEKLLIEQWKTMRNTHVNRPRELLRSLIIDSLEVVGRENPEFAFSIWNTASSVFRHGQEKLGKEIDIVTNFLKGFAESTENKAVGDSGFSASVSKKAPTKRRKQSAQFKVSSVPKIKADHFLKDVASSAGPSINTGETLEDPNPHWPNQNDHWVNQFVPRMSTTISKAVNLGLSNIEKTLSADIQKQSDHVEKNIADSLKSLKTIQNEVWAPLEAIQIQLNVLWWTKASYSPILMKGYQEIEPEIAVLIMAIDLSTIVPSFTPASVTFILGNTAAQMFESREDTKPVKITNILSVFQEKRSLYKEFLIDVLKNNTRKSLYELIVEIFNNGDFKIDKLESISGIDPNLELTYSEVAMWIFRDIQAQRTVGAIQ